jgi:hypothetical protein
MRCYKFAGIILVAGSTDIRSLAYHSRTCMMRVRLLRCWWYLDGMHSRSMITSDDIVPRVRRTQESETCRKTSEMMPHSSNLQGCGAAGVCSGRAGTCVACLTWDARLRPWRSAWRVCWRVTSAIPQADQHIIPSDQQLQLLDFHVSASPCCPRALFPSHLWLRRHPGNPTPS